MSYRVSQDACAHDGEWKTCYPPFCARCGISGSDERLKGTQFYTPPIPMRPDGTPNIRFGEPRFLVCSAPAYNPKVKL